MNKIKGWYIPEQPGDNCYGYYGGCIDNPYGCEEYPPSLLHYIYTADYCYQFFGSTMLDKLLKQIEHGTPIIIMYKGKKKIKGNRYMHDYKVTKGVVDDED